MKPQAALALQDQEVILPPPGRDLLQGLQQVLVGLHAVGIALLRGR